MPPPASSCASSPATAALSSLRPTARTARRIVTASGDQTARIWDAATGEELRQLTGHSGAVSSAAYSPDGKHIVTASDDQTARIWDAATGEELRQLTGHSGTVTSAAYSPDGKTHRHRQ